MILGVIMQEMRNYDDPQYKKWRYLVYKRDAFTCRLCGSNNDLQAHHIKRWSEFPTLRFVVNNGITLCKLCHTLVKDREAEHEAQFTALVGKKATGRRSKAAQSTNDDALFKIRAALRKRSE